MTTVANARQMTAAEVRQRGDATQDERAELHVLIKQKAVTEEWKQRLFDDIFREEGLSSARAKSTLTYLRRLPDRSAQPVYATAAQAEEFRNLVATRTAPRGWIAPLLERLEAGTLTYDLADLTISDLRRLPLKKYVVPHQPDAGGRQFDDGCYSLRRIDGTVRHYRIKTVGGHRQVDQLTYKFDPATGETVINRRRLRGYQATEVTRAVAADPAAAAVLFATTTKRCTSCNRPIQDSENNPGFRYGYGPDCWADREAIRRNADHRAQLSNDTPGEPVSLASTGAAS